jgi:hypothetical protein
MSVAEMTAVFGWMLVLNLGLYLISAGFLIFARDWVCRFEARMTGVPAEDWPKILVDYLGRYKLAILVLNLVPYLALRIVG